jgi:hypothetical protein
MSEVQSFLHSVADELQGEIDSEGRIIAPLPCQSWPTRGLRVTFDVNSPLGFTIQARLESPVLPLKDYKPDNNEDEHKHHVIAAIARVLFRADV